MHGDDESRRPPAYDEATSQDASTSALLGGTASTLDHGGEGHSPGPSGPHGSTRLTMGGGYRPPTVETPRSSEETDVFLSSTSDSRGHSVDEMRNGIEQMEIVEDPEHPLFESPTKRSRLRVQLSRRLAGFTSTVSSLRLRFCGRWPRFRGLFHRTQTVKVIAGLASVVLVVAGTYFLLSVSSSSSISEGETWREKFNPEAVRGYVQGHVSGDRIRRVMERITAYDHLAGTQGDYASASYVRAHLEAAKLEDVHTKESVAILSSPRYTSLKVRGRYQVYLNYPRPRGRRVAIITPSELAREVKLEEEPIYLGRIPPVAQTPAFHGHSRSGNVTGPLVYANFGSREDFKTLQRQGVKVSGSIALVRYSGSRGDDGALKVKAAELAGAVGCLIYSDPNDDGFKKGDVWPNGRWRPSDSVRRGPVSLMSLVVGDVLTPGYASTVDAKRVSTEKNPGLVNIPSLPLAWRDAQRLIQSLKGYGHKVEADWIGGVPDVEEWWSGDQKSPVVLLANEQEEVERQPIWNVMGKITGVEQKEKTVIVGSHRDAWCFGAAGSGGGTAIWLEVMHIFAELVQAGWRPLRTIQFASWDGHGYNVIGSTEWVEDHLEELRRDGVAYLNLDVAVSGTEFRASASPLFQRMLLRALDRTVDPKTNETLRSIWDGKQQRLQGLGGRGDYVAFQDLAGTSSIDIGFGEGDGFPSGSCYDHFEWMTRFGDPGLDYHQTLAQVWALMILQMVDEPLVAFDFEAYAQAIKGYVNVLERDAKKIMDDDDDDKNENKKETRDENDVVLDMKVLHQAADQFIQEATLFQAWEQTWYDAVQAQGDGMGSTSLAIRRMSHNSRMSNFDTHLLDLHGGIPNRTQFKHVLFAPSLWSEDDSISSFPAVRDALLHRDLPLAQRQIQRAADILSRASRKLLH